MHGDVPAYFVMNIVKSVNADIRIIDIIIAVFLYFSQKNRAAVKISIKGIKIVSIQAKGRIKGMNSNVSLNFSRLKNLLPPTDAKRIMNISAIKSLNCILSFVIGLFAAVVCAMSNKVYKIC